MTVTKSLCPRTAVNRLRCRRTKSEPTANRGVRRAVSLWSTSKRPSFGFPAPSLDFESRVKTSLSSGISASVDDDFSMPGAMPDDFFNPKCCGDGGERPQPSCVARGTRKPRHRLLQPVLARPSWRLLPSAASVSTKRILSDFDRVTSASCRIWSVKHTSCAPPIHVGEPEPATTATC